MKAVATFGTAKNRGTTEGAAWGAFTIRCYRDPEEANRAGHDWIEIIAIQEVEVSAAEITHMQAVPLGANRRHSQRAARRRRGNPARKGA